MHVHNRVLLFGHEDVLLETRALVLEKTGFQVWIAHTLDEAAESMVVQQIDGFILCQTLSRTERWEALTLAEALRPEMNVLVIEDEFARLPKDKTAHVLRGVPAPANLVEAVERLMKGGAPHSEHL